MSIDDATPADWDSAAAMAYFEGLTKKENWDGYTKIRLEPNGVVDKPRHYTHGKIECIEYIRDQVEDFESYCMGNVLKYVSRYRHKGAPVDDLRKARVYLDWLIGEVNSDR